MTNVRYVATIEVYGDESAFAQKKQLLKLIESKMLGLKPKRTEVEALFSELYKQPTGRAIAYDFAIGMGHLPDLLKH
jgi:hypothetical protein